MKNKQSQLPVLVALFGVALLVTCIARVGLAVMDSTGVLGYNYRAATAPYVYSFGSTLDQLTTTLLGSTLISFMFAGGLALSLATASILLFTYCHRSHSHSIMASSFIWGFLTSGVSLICLVILISGSYSRVLLEQLGNKGGGIGAVIGLLFIVIATFIAAASCVCTYATRVKDPKRAIKRVFLSVVVCGALVCVLTVGTFGALNAEEPHIALSIGWLAASILVNVALVVVSPYVLRSEL